MPAAPEVLEFDPVHLLIEDSVGDIPPEINDFFDKLLDPFASGHTHGDQSIGDSSPIDAPMTPNYISSFAASKRNKSSSERYVGSPISTMEPADFGSPQSPKSSKSGSRSSSPPNSSGAHLSRKNKQQRCSICKECGHKSRTCRFGQQGDNQAVDVLPMDSPPSSSRRSHFAQADAL